MSVSPHDHDMPAEDVVEEIRREYRILRRLQYQEELKLSWEKAPDTLDAEPLNSFRRGYSLVKEISNKLTLLYWASDAQGEDGFGEKTILGYGRPAAAICKKWFRLSPEPKIDFDYYFAKPFQVTKAGPSEISGLLHAHRLLCTRATELLNQKLHLEPEYDSKYGRAYYSGYGGLKNYMVLPLCRALMVVLDKRVEKSELKDLKMLQEPYQPHSLDRFAQLQTLLMVRTGDESELSASINFSEIDGEILPLDRPDVTLESGIEAVRVTVPTAVLFISRLQQREEDAFPEKYANPNIDKPKNIGLSMNGSTWYPASEDEWVKAVCDRGGDWLGDAMERVRKREAGDKAWDDVSAQDWWNSKWK